VKVILVDHFNRERPGLSDDLLIAERVSEHFVETIVASLNGPRPDDDYVFRAVPDDYELRKFT